MRPPGGSELPILEARTNGHRHCVRVIGIGRDSGYGRATTDRDKETWSCKAVDVGLSKEVPQHVERSSLAAERVRARGGGKPRGGADDLRDSRTLGADRLFSCSYVAGQFSAGWTPGRCPRDRRACGFFRDRSQLGVPIVSDVGRAASRAPQT